MARTPLEPQPVTGAGSGDLYLVPTVPVPPTLLEPETGLYAPVPIIHADSTNVGQGTYPTIVGAYRPNNAYTARLIPDNLGWRSVASTTGSKVLVRVPEFYLSVDEYRNPLTGSLLADVNFFMDVRFILFGTCFKDGSGSGTTKAWLEVTNSTDFITVTPPNTAFVGAPRLLAMPDGSTLLFVVTRCSSGNRLYVFRYDPKSEQANYAGDLCLTKWFAPYAQYPNATYPSGTGAVMQDANNLNMPGTVQDPGVNDFEPFLIGSIPHVLLSFAYPANQLRILRLLGTTFTDAQSRLVIKTDTTTANYPNVPHLEGGVSVAHLSNGQDLYAFTFNSARSSSTHRRSVHLVSNSHFSVDSTPVDPAKLPTLSGYVRTPNGLPGSTTCVSMFRPRTRYNNLVYPPYDANYYDDSFFSALGWAGTALGQIYVTSDGGRNWDKLSVPTEAANTVSKQPAPIRAICAVERDCNYVDDTSGTIVIVAVGDHGLIMTCTWIPLKDTTQTWKVLRYNPTGIDATFTTAQRLANVNTKYAELTGWVDCDYKCVYGVATNANPATIRFWAGGAQGTIYAFDSSATTELGSGTGFARVSRRLSSGAYTGLVSDCEQTFLIAVGEAGVHSDLTDDNKMSRAVTYDAAGSLNGGNKAYYLLPAVADETGEIAASPMVGITRLHGSETLNSGSAAAYAYTMSQDGKVYRWRHALAARFEQIADFGPAATLISIDAARNCLESVAPTYLYIGGQTNAIPGALWIADNANATIADNPVTPAFNPQLLPSLEPPLAIAFETPVDGTAVCASGTFYSINTWDSRTHPSLLVTSTGAILLAVANITRGRIEVFYANTFSPTGYPVFQLADSAFSFSPFVDNHFDTADFLGTTKDLPRPDLAEDLDGTLILSCRGKHRYSLNGGRLWSDMNANDPSVPIPLGELSTGDQLSFMGEGPYAEVSVISAGGGANVDLAKFMTTRGTNSQSPFDKLRSIGPTRSLCALSGGQLGSAAYNNNLTRVGVWIARQWVQTGSAIARSVTRRPVPILTGREYALLDGAVQVQWIGDRLEDGNKWTVSPESLYPTKNMMSDSPRAEWWRSVDFPDRMHTGAGYTTVLRWNRLSAETDAIMGEGDAFDMCGFALKGVNFQQAQIRLYSPAWTRITAFKAIRSVRYSGNLAASFASVSSVVRDAGTPNWIPHQFAPANDEWFVTILYNTGARVFRIVDNTENCLILDTTGQATVPTVSTVAYELWSDTLYWDGENADGGLVEDNTPNSLRGSYYRFVQGIELGFPDQPTADGYFKIGKATLGVFVVPDPPTGATDAARYHAPDWGWTPIPNTLEEAALDGVTLVEHFAQIQEWSLTYPAAPDWYRARLTHAFMRESRMRGAFCWIPNPTDVTVPPRLVRLIDGPPVRGVALSYATIDLRLREVR